MKKIKINYLNSKRNNNYQNKKQEIKNNSNKNKLKNNKLYPYKMIKNTKTLLICKIVNVS